MESQPQNPEIRINPETFTHNISTGIHTSVSVVCVTSSVFTSPG